MERELVELIYGSLLHDIGKIVYRSDNEFGQGTHSKIGYKFLASLNNDELKKSNIIKYSVKYHHAKELNGAKSRIDENTLGYITYIADNISSANDRRDIILEDLESEEIEGDEEKKGKAKFQRTLPLSSVFNILNNNSKEGTYAPLMITEKENEGIINYPTANAKEYTSGYYNGIKTKIADQLRKIEVKESNINSLLHLLEVTTSFVPSSTATDQLNDISLYDHSKTTAAIASCIYYYLKDKEEKSLKDKLFEEKSAKKFYQEKVYLLYSIDISGIQNFIYTISGKGAVKQLRSRSLYLELLLENIIDELLEKLELSRCNLIYTGGGHGYVLLPNTEKVKETLQDFDGELKEWFISQFDIDLYAASGYTECSSKELEEDIGSVYKRVSEEISKKKSHRYTAEDILKLNTFTNEKNHRECSECKTSKHLVPVGENTEDERFICEFCKALGDISEDIVKKDTYFVVDENNFEKLPEKYLQLPFGKTLTIKKKDDIKPEDYKRIYSKNKPSMGENFATNLWVGDYHIGMASNWKIKDFSDMAKVAEGINRIGVLRADVDNLGKAFMNGFDKEKGYETLSRTATLSRHLSMFFKYYINTILKDKNAIIVYSGGDDMFIVGGWDEIIDISKDIQEKFRDYTLGSLTISAGIGIYPPSYPIARIAKEVGALEEAAKEKDESKNKVTLFNKGIRNNKGEVTNDWVLAWNQIDSVKEKLKTLEDTFNKDDEHGKAFLYKTLDLLRNAHEEPINIARFAYTLARAKNRLKSKDENVKFDETKFYSWILDAEGEDKNINRKEAEIAITLYSYKTR